MVSCTSRKNSNDVYVSDMDSVAVMDSMRPDMQDDRKGYNIDNIKGKCTLQVFLSMNEDGTGSFEYLYWPMTDNTEYLASSAEGLMNSHAIVVMDENWNILN